MPNTPVASSSFPGVAGVEERDGLLIGVQPGEIVLAGADRRSIGLRAEERRRISYQRSAKVLVPPGSQYLFCPLPSTRTAATRPSDPRTTTQAARGAWHVTAGGAVPKRSPPDGDPASVSVVPDACAEAPSWTSPSCMGRALHGRLVSRRRAPTCDGRARAGRR